MDEFKGYIKIGKANINRIVDFLNHHEIIVTMVDFEIIKEMFLFLEGYIACLEKYGNIELKNDWYEIVCKISTQID